MLSSIPRSIRFLLGPIVAALASNNEERKDRFAATQRRTFVLSQFNIVKKESLGTHPLSEIKIPLYSWPLINLPSSKLAGKNH